MTQASIAFIAVFIFVAWAVVGIVMSAERKSLERFPDDDVRPDTPEVRARGAGL